MVESQFFVWSSDKNWKTRTNKMQGLIGCLLVGFTLAKMLYITTKAS